MLSLRIAKLASPSLLVGLISLFCCLPPSPAKCQSPYPVVINPDFGAKISDFKESYDHGFLFTGQIDDPTWPGKPLIGWLVKTDINGQLLWDKKIGNVSYLSFIRNMDQDAQGNLYLAGGTTENDYLDAMVMKLDPCGNKLWCTIFHTLENHQDFGILPLAREDGGCYFAWQYPDSNIHLQRYALASLDPNGAVEWVSYFPLGDTCPTSPTMHYGEEFYGLQRLPDGGFLATGHTYWVWNAPTVTLRAFWVKLSEEGEVVWQKPWRTETLVYGQAKSGFYDSVNHQIYSVGKLREEHGTYHRPALYKLTGEGDSIASYRFNFPGSSEYSIGWVVKQLEDKRLVVAGGHTLSQANDEHLTSIWLADTLGHISDSMILTHQQYPTGNIVITHDDKLLVAPAVNDWDILKKEPQIYKLNMDLEPDSLYTIHPEYDYLCSQPVASDTIPIEGNLYVGLDKIPVANERVQLKVYPNPVEGWLTVETPAYVSITSGQAPFQAVTHRYQYQGTLQLFNLQGNLVQERAVTQGERLQLNMQGLIPGLYALRLVCRGNVVATVKVVKQ